MSLMIGSNDDNKEFPPLYMHPQDGLVIGYFQAQKHHCGRLANLGYRWPRAQCPRGGGTAAHLDHLSFYLKLDRVSEMPSCRTSSPLMAFIMYAELSLTMISFIRKER